MNYDYDMKHGHSSD